MIARKKPKEIRSEYMDILSVVAKAASNNETVQIRYPKTENTGAGWREIEPYSLSTDIGESGEHLIWKKDMVSPGHILNGYTLTKKSDHCDSFIIGKIKDAKFTNKKFEPRNGWKIEF